MPPNAPPTRMYPSSGTIAKDLPVTHFARNRTGHVVFAPQTSAQRQRREYECIFMQPGRVKQADQEPSHWLIPAPTIQNAASKFNAVSSFLDHPDLFGFGYRDEPKVSRLVGVTFNAQWSNELQALVGGIRLYDDAPGSPGHFVGTLLDQILTDQERGLEVPPVGLSAAFFHTATFDEEAGLRITTDIRHVESVDFVYDAGAGGYVKSALAAIQPQQSPSRSFQSVHLGGTMAPENQSTTEQADPTQETAAPPSPVIVDINESVAAVQQVAERLEALLNAQNPPPIEGPALNAPPDRVSELESVVERLSASLAEQEEARTITNMGEIPRLTRARTGMDQVELALTALIEGAHPPSGIAPLTGIRELYQILSGDWEMTGLFHDERVYLANVTSSTMANLVANVLNKRIVNLFAEYPKWWTPIVTVEDFATLQDARWISLGGVGELPTVAEGAAYTELTWDDFAETDAFIKKGGYLGITIEAIDKDDTARVRTAPRALAQAAWLTLSKSVSAIFTTASGTGPTMSDSNVLFDASNHSNLGTTALSHAAWVTTRTAMRKQTEINSSERLGALTAPKYLLVPPDLEVTGLQALASEGVPGTANNDINPFAVGNAHNALLASARDRVIVVDLWTDTNNWAAVADPLLYPSIGLGFRYGRTPEIFSVASPTAGLMFTNDTMPVKVRFFYAVGPTDWRGLYKHNVS